MVGKVKTKKDGKRFEQAMKGFDFAKVVRMMGAVGWVYGSPGRSVTVEDARACCRELFQVMSEDALNCRSGGFKVYPSGTIEFIGEDWDY